MRPRNDSEALVDVLDVIMRDGVVVQADIMIGLADVPLIGINLRAALAGMATMREYGLFEEWDRDSRRQVSSSESYTRAAAVPVFESPERRPASSDP